MKWKTPLIILMLILTTVLSGCLPSVPKKITGPTWTSKYRIPVIDRKKISFGPETEEEDGLGLEEVKINYESSSKVDGPATFNLLDERVTIEDVAIASTIEFTPITSGEYLIEDDPNKKVDVSFTGLDDYTSVTLSENGTTYNKIDIRIEGATAGAETLILTLKDQENTLINQVTIPAGGEQGQLSIDGLILSPNSTLSFEADGSLFVADGFPPVKIIFTPTDLEIESFTIKAGQLGAIDRFLSNEPVEIIDLDFPTDADLFNLHLKTAELNFTPIAIPEHLLITANLIVELSGENGTESATWEIEFNEDQDYSFADLKETLNSILENKNNGQTLSIRIDNIDVSSAGDVTIAYPGEIRLNHNTAFALDYLTHASSAEGESGSVDLPEDLPLEYKGCKYEPGRSYPRNLVIIHTDQFGRPGPHPREQSESG